MSSTVIIQAGSRRVVYHPGRQQPYTIWDGEETVYFCDSFIEAQRRIASKDAA